MPRRHALALVIAACLLTPPRTAVAGGPAAPTGARQPDLKAMMERNKQCLRDASAHASRARFDRKDLERFLAERESFEALELDGAKDDANGPRCPDFAEAVKNPRYVSWARARGLDPKDWFTKSLRISLTNVKRRAPAQNAQLKAQMDAQRKELAQRCKSMGPGACADVERMFAQGDDLIRETAAMMALLPDPTPAEAALLVEYDARLREADEGRHRRGHRAGAPDAGDADAPEDAPEDAPDPAGER